MPPSVQMRACIVITFFLATSAGAARAADQQPDNWLCSSGKELQLCLRGEVFDSDGQPAKNLQVVGNMNATIGDEPLQPLIDGHRFEIRIPVNQPHWYSVALKASSADSDHVAYKLFNAYQLRQAAIDGIKLTLEPPTRQVDIKVTHKDQPVSGAPVKAGVGFGIELQSTTDERGIARFALLPQQELDHLTAWTNDRRIGGFTFSRTPPRDAEDSEHVIELSRCREQKVRFVAEDDSPATGVRFALQIATPPPHYNYIGFTDHAEMTTDAVGEAVWPWFPDWDDLHFYAEIDETKWIVVGDPKIVDGVAIITVKERKPRKQITGRVASAGTNTSPGGFYVHFRSFQGEREHHSDLDSAFSDPDGTYSVTVLPDATYCAYVLDEQWVGKLIDVIPYESETGKAASPELTVAEGQPVEVIVTSGPKKVPIENLTVSFRRDHNFTWLENGEVRHGLGGPQFWATTDKSGKATTRTLPGTMTASIYTSRWRTEKSVDVVANKPVQIALHREIDEKRIFTGRVVFDAEAGGNLEDVEVRVGSLDENYEDEQSFQCKPHGLFSFDTFAAEVGIFACTKDGKAAGSIITRDLGWRIKIPLLPTCEYKGQLLGPGDQPLVSHSVRAHVRLEGKRAKDVMLPPTFDVKHLETKTDAQGNFTLTDLPSHIKVSIWADAIDGSEDNVHIDDVFLEPNETQPRAISRLAK